MTPRELLVERGWSSLTALLTPHSFRVLIACETLADRKRLTSREFEVSEQLAHGLKSHEVGERLAITGATVRGAGDRAMVKLGLLRPVQLVLLWEALEEPGNIVRYAAMELRVFELGFGGRRLETLTGAQGAVVLGLMEGELCKSIAERRKVSVRTVGRQLALLFQRFRVNCQEQLMMKLLERDWE